MRSRLVGKARIYARTSEPVGDGMRGALVGEMNRRFGGDQNRRICLGWIFTSVGLPISSKSLGKGQWWAIREWVGLEHDDSGWHCCPSFLTESVKVLSEALRSYGSITRDWPVELLLEADAPVVTKVVSELGAEIKRVDQGEQSERKTENESRGTGEKVDRNQGGTISPF